MNCSAKISYNRDKLYNLHEIAITFSCRDQPIADVSLSCKPSNITDRFKYMKKILYTEEDHSICIDGINGGLWIKKQKNILQFKFIKCAADIPWTSHFYITVNEDTAKIFDIEKLCE